MKTKIQTIFSSLLIFLGIIFLVQIITHGYLLNPRLSVDSSYAAVCNLDKNYLKINVTKAVCLDCLYNAAKLQMAYQRDNPTALSTCTKPELVNYWCNGGWGVEAKNDCSQKVSSTSAALNICKNECVGVKISPPVSTPTTSAKKNPTATPIPKKQVANPTPTPKSVVNTQGFCQQLDDKDPSTKLNVLFLPSQYTNKNTFISDAKKAIAFMSGTNINQKLDSVTGRPLMGKLKFWAFTDITRDYKVNFEGGDSRAIHWDLPAAQNIAKSCGGIKAYVLTVNSDKKAGLSYLGTGDCSITNQDPAILVHELGHCIASLNDEYLVNNEDAPSSGGYPMLINCTDLSAEGYDNPRRACEGWK